MFLAANFIFDETLPILSNDLFIEEIYLAAFDILSIAKARGFTALLVIQSKQII